MVPWYVVSGAEGFDCFCVLAVRLWRGRDDLGHTGALQQGFQSIDVVAVIVGQDEGVQLPNPQQLQLVAQFVSGTVHAAASAVHHGGVILGHKQYALPLSHVQHLSGHGTAAHRLAVAHHQGHQCGNGNAKQPRHLPIFGFSQVVQQQEQVSKEQPQPHPRGRPVQRRKGPEGEPVDARRKAIGQQGYWQRQQLRQGQCHARQQSGQESAAHEQRDAPEDG